MRKNLFSILVLLLTMVTQGAWAWSGSGTAEDPYLISSTSDWNTFATDVSNGTNADKCFKLTADISVITIVGTKDKPFKGTFDGNGHTITVDITVESDNADTPAAPFAALCGATIENLNVAGSITTNGRHPAGITSFVTATDENTPPTTISYCKSSVAITSSYDSEVEAGGLVGQVNLYGTTLNMNNSAFTGSITYTHSGGYRGGGLVGWTDTWLVAANLNTCFFAPTSVSFVKESGNDFKRFVGGASPYETITNCYYNGVARDYSKITDEDGTLIPTAINNNSDWETFGTLVSNGFDYHGQTVTLNSNISVTKVVGAIDRPFGGTFEGNSRTLTVNINVSSDNEHTPAAPFAELSGATIQNLNVAGSITTNGMRPASIAGLVVDNSEINNCMSSVAITSSYGADIDAGGFVGRVNVHKSLTMNGCAFTGSITYTNAYGYEGGGFVGWLQEGASVTPNYCLFAPTSLSFTKGRVENKFNMFAGGWGTRNFTNCFYNNVAADNGKITTIEGKRMRSISADGSVSSLAISGESTEYNVSDITGYEVGIKYIGVYYAADEYVVPLTLSHSDPPSGKFFDQYKVAGGGSLLEQTETTAVLSMTDANQTIIAQYVSAEDVEGPWTLQGMKTHVCPNDGSSTSVSFNNMNNNTWSGTTRSWQDGDGVGYTFEGQSPSLSTMGIFSTYLCEKTVTSYSSLKVTWKYQLRSKSTKHHSTTCIYARQGTYDDIKNMEVDFTNYHTSGKGLNTWWMFSPTKKKMAKPRKEARKPRLSNLTTSMAVSPRRKTVI